MLRSLSIYRVSISHIECNIKEQNREIRHMQLWYQSREAGRSNFVRYLPVDQPVVKVKADNKDKFDVKLKIICYNPSPHTRVCNAIKTPLNSCTLG